MRDPVKREAYNAAYRAAHHEELVAKEAAYNAAHREQRLAYNATRRQVSAAYMREWRLRNRLAAAALAAANFANVNASRRGLAGRLRVSDVLSLWGRQPVCVGCGRGRGLDHIVAVADGGPNTPDNIQTMCRPCNVRKEYAAKRVRAAHAGIA